MNFNIDNLVGNFVDKFGGMTEEYKFYNGDITLRYDPKDHVYLLVTPEGLVKQDGVTTICHIVDKSMVLIPWACKMMAQKIQETIPSIDVLQGLNYDSFTKAVNSSKSAHKEKLEEAGNIGNLAHNWIEQYIKAKLKNDSSLVEQILASFPNEERAKNACIAALDWMAQHNVRWISTERKVYSREYQYAGTMDGLCIADSCNNPNCCPVKFKDKRTLADWKTSNYLYLEFIMQTAAYKRAYQEETKEIVDDIWVIRLGKEDAAFDPWHLTPEIQGFGLMAFLKALDLSRAYNILEDLVGTLKDYRKGVQKAIKAKKKVEDAKVRCKSAGRYKGMRKPTCNNGHPCETCLLKYNQEQAAKAQRLLDLKETKTVVKKAKKTPEEILKGLKNLLDKPQE